MGKIFEQLNLASHSLSFPIANYQKPMLARSTTCLSKGFNQRLLILHILKGQSLLPHLSSVIFKCINILIF